MFWFNLPLFTLIFSIASSVEIQASVLFSFAITWFFEPLFTRRAPINRRSVKMFEGVLVQQHRRERVAGN